MYPDDQQFRHRSKARAAVAVVLLIAGLAGCAPDSMTSGDRSPANAAPYVGVFTGDFIDGKPLYRLPAIEVIGFRSSLVF
jgi:hypothetical protein